MSVGTKTKADWMKRFASAVLVGFSAAAGQAFTVIGDESALRIVRPDETILVFEKDGTARVTQDGTIDLFLVGGGGGGGLCSPTDGKTGGGGGGGGGVVYQKSISVQVGTYAITIGSGGAVGENGGNTTAFGLTAYGGGAGGQYGGHDGKGGASGGGSTYKYEVNDHAELNKPRAGGQALYSEQNNSGSSGGWAKHVYGAGGGGGAGGEGWRDETLSVAIPGNGGDGISCQFMGENFYFGGGGAGYRIGHNASGGKGGGGALITVSGVTTATPGTDGLGGGGCGGTAGGHGVVFCRFTPTAPMPENTSDFQLFGGIEPPSPDQTEAVHYFHESGPLVVTGTGRVEILVVGGGGGGGKSSNSAGCGGGGGGGVVHNESLIVYPGLYQITVGAGGEVDQNGQPSVALGLKAFGGGAGAAAGGHQGGSGASGGGATHRYAGDPVPGGQPLYEPWNNRGHAGGSACHMWAGAGGGGAGKPGVDGDGTSTPTSGGDGYACAITGQEEYYGGGGCGYRWDRTPAITGGKGGGGNYGHPGEDFLGGGGCGAQRGGKGVVIIRYRKPAIPEDIPATTPATGGTFVRTARFGIHTFTQSGTLTIPEAEGRSVEVLLVGGGGGGGASTYNNETGKNTGGGGGGGGGGVVCFSTYLAPGNHTLTIGAGGGVGENGGETIAFGATAFGGGGGGAGRGHAGKNGASGGGGTSPYEKEVLGGSALYTHAFNNGHAGGSSQNVWGPGGGGGAGEAAKRDPNKTLPYPGLGGDGLAVSITGQSVYYGGGGAGFRYGSQFATPGGKGGGGACTGLIGEPGVNGLGGGGCGDAVGGSGVIIVRYRLPEYGTLLLIR